MAASIGRNLKVYLGASSPLTLVAAVREKSVEFNGTPVDVTTDDNLGWRTLLDDINGQTEVNITVSGVLTDATLKTNFFAGNTTNLMRVLYPDNGEVEGTFKMVTYSETGTYNDTITFEASFQSSGNVTFTAGA